MRKRIEYRNEDQVAAMRAFMIDAMVEEDQRDFDNDFEMEFFGMSFTKTEIETASTEEVIESFTAFTKGYRYEEEDFFSMEYDFVEETNYINHYYGFELA